MRENIVSPAVRLVFGQAEGFVLWLNPVGFDHEKKIRYGLQVGSSDLIGLAPGGLFLAVETKGTKTVTSEEQLRYLQLVYDCGGVACCIGKSIKTPEAATAAAQEMVRGIRAGIRRHGW